MADKKEKVTSVDVDKDSGDVSETCSGRNKLASAVIVVKALAIMSAVSVRYAHLLSFRRCRISSHLLLPKYFHHICLEVLCNP